MPWSIVLLQCAVTPSSDPPFATPSPSALKGNKSTAATRRDCHQLLSAVFATGNICCQGFQHFVQVLSSLFTHFVVCIIRFNVCLFLSHRFNCLWLEKHVHLEVIPLSSVFVYPESPGMRVFYGLLPSILDQRTVTLDNTILQNIRQD